MELEFIPQKKYMLKALELAASAARLGEIPVGAVIELNGEIIGTGINTREVDKNPMGHAEINAINQAANALGDWRLTGANLYVTLEPCPMCAGAIINSRINRVIFGADDSRAGSCGSLVNLFKLPYTHQPKIFPNYMEEECRLMLKEFFSKMRL